MEEIKKYCLEKAIQVGGENIIQNARDFYNFLAPETIRITGELLPPVVRPLAALDMPIARRKVLQALIAIHQEGEKPTGALLGQRTKMSQTNASAHIRKLIQSGHVKRSGHQIWPVLTPDGTPYVMPITKLPDGYAKGYKPMTQKLGDIAAVRNA